MNRIIVAALLSTALSSVALAQSAADLKNAANTPDRVLTYGMSYDQLASLLQQRGMLSRWT